MSINCSFQALIQYLLLKRSSCFTAEFPFPRDERRKGGEGGIVLILLLFYCYPIVIP